jgi:cation diffusion facilitator CzcD-associated flavoprotein CzcO
LSLGELRQSDVEHLDVVIVGAGLSGIGAAYYLQDRLPQKSFAILESRGALGGTWDLFRYPGIRSDSDLHTYGFAFKPWEGPKAIADGPAILNYIHETVAENGIAPKIRFHHRITRAHFDSEEARWLLEVERTDTGERLQLSCWWLLGATGYFNYEGGFVPRFDGIERFQGELIHPQQWPEDLDYAGRKVVVIGSGATAMTIVPAIADAAASVTMVQRSPTYVLSLPGEDPIANGLKRVMSSERAYALTRAKNVWLQRTIYSLSQNRPRLMRRIFFWAMRHHLPEGYEVGRHFNPTYKPWDQRLCIVPDADLFRAISAGTVSIVTDAIEQITERGVRLASGAELEADIIVTATGLDLLPLGGIELTVDGEPVSLADSLAYKSAVLSDVPNFAFAVGYTNASWTLKLNLLWDYVCRVIALMDRRGDRIAVPVNDDPAMPRRPLLDFSAGYVRRAVADWPKQGTGPWSVEMSYQADARRLRDGVVEDGVLRFSPVSDKRRQAA